MAGRTRQGMTPAELHALPVSVPLVLAGRALGLGREASYDLYHRGELPVRVLKVGSRYVVPRAELFRALGIDQDGQAANAG